MKEKILSSKHCHGYFICHIIVFGYICKYVCRYNNFLLIFILTKIETWCYDTWGCKNLSFWHATNKHLKYSLREA